VSPFRTKIFSYGVRTIPSPSVMSSSWSFSPGRRPVNLISISTSGLKPDRRMRSRAISMTFIGASSPHLVDL